MNFNWNKNNNNNEKKKKKPLSSCPPPKLEVRQRAWPLTPGFSFGQGYLFLAIYDQRQCDKLSFQLSVTHFLLCRVAVCGSGGSRGLVVYGFSSIYLVAQCWRSGGCVWSLGKMASLSEWSCNWPGFSSTPLTLHPSTPHMGLIKGGWGFRQGGFKAFISNLAQPELNAVRRKPLVGFSNGGREDGACPNVNRPQRFFQNQGC